MSDEPTAKKQRPQKGESNKFAGRDFAKPLSKETSTEISLTLTDAEREAIAVAMHRCDTPHYSTLKSLLARTKQNNAAG